MAADMLPFKAPPPPVFTWTGGYIGVTAGAAWGSYDPRTVTNGDGAGFYLNPAQGAAVTAAGNQSIKPAGFSTGVEAGYNWQNGPFLLGVEADLQAVHLNGAANSGAVPYPGAPAVFFVTSAYAHTDWLFTGRARAGFVANNNWLFYATGGLALTSLNTDFVFSDNNGALEASRINTVRAGYAVGGGVEAPLTNRLSLKAEYLYVNFGGTTGSVTANNVTAFFPNQAFTHSADLKASIVRVGLNYHFDGVDPLTPKVPFMPVKASVLKAPPLIASEWEVETGARVWFSSGRIGAPNPLFNLNPPPTLTLASRLTYKDLNGFSGETFARVDHSSGVFVKGFLGAGAITSGKLLDEDFPAGGGVYSNTLSSASGHLAYANIDLGYNFITAPGAKVGAFVGYNYFTQHINTYSCTQLAGSSTCTAGFPVNFLGIAEDDRFNSLRVGVAAQFMLTERLKLTAEAAYLPWVGFKGQDDHNARQLLLPEQSSWGDGVMLEAILGYNITDAWNVGVGGRYWAWNMRNGTTTFNFLGAAGPPPVEPSRFNTERYGVFVQTSYRWGDTTPGASAARMPTKAPVLAAAPMNWSGFYIGGHLGGGWSDDRWSDPFGPTVVGAFVNVAGFGDKIHAAGPLGGGQIGFNLQSGQWVFGVQADASAADLRGENTCFSGLGGINCQRVVNSLGTVTGRVGLAWDRSLAYVKGGGAWTNTTYNLLGNTFAVTLGNGSTSLTQWGWTVGGGFEYALTNNWTTLLEFDHIGLSNTTVAFPTVALVNAQSISVRQWIDVIKVGVNYKFDWAGPVVAKY
jgi:opacity protein-like surface antigen